MIPHSRLVAVVAVLVAFGAHAGGLGGFGSRDTVEIEGGGDVEEAALGASFADMTAGTISPAEAHEVEQPTPEEAEETQAEQVAPAPEAAPEKPVEVAKPVEVSKPVAVAKPVAAVAPVQQKPQDLPPLVPIVADQVRKEEAAKPLEMAMVTPAGAEIPPQESEPVQAAKPTEAAEPVVETVPEPVKPIEAIEPQPEVAPVEPRLAAIRPVSRPERPVETKPAKKKPKKTESKPQVAAKAGSSTQNARKGTETGTKPKGSANSRKSASASGAAGNAAASNYPGLVKRKIHRARRKSVKVRGTARVSFRIADSGALAAVSISRSSGSNRLDQVALAQVRAAAPFPKPPAGARRQFSVEIKGN
ncbi:TonB family protein [Tropicibacter sp. R16_0]|uniref:energy transducer TonB family protein n=1 Tax=Tropicibacter sp. R16_0 TaxID=2821102 RepID=UPI001ADB75F2|nr:TonB family protein [Tropicibacter sp. R16_0]MBO9452054.1 TonB family protein [Tropicibacter sp. R16_0]